SAAEFAARTGKGDERNQLLDNICRQWARSDAQAALHWAESLGEPGTSNSLLSGIISVIAEDDRARQRRCSPDFRPVRRKQTQPAELFGIGRQPIRNPPANGRLLCLRARVASVLAKA